MPEKGVPNQTHLDGQKRSPPASRPSIIRHPLDVEFTSANPPLVCPCMGVSF